MDIEPDSIEEQVPKILQLWFAATKKSTHISTYIKQAKETLTAPKWYYRWFKYPSQSFRLTFIGSFIGFLGAYITLTLLFMQSKSKRHTDLKYGVALGNMLAFLVIIVVSMFFSGELYYKNTHVYCTSCELVVLDYSEPSNLYNLSLNDTTIKDCVKNCKYCNRESYNYTECLGGTCHCVYAKCEVDYALSLALLVLIGVQSLMIIGTGLVASWFMRTETFSVSLQ